MMVINLTGLSGDNPLGFFAALGLLRVLDDDASRRGVRRPTIAFAAEGPPTAALHTDLGFERVCEVVVEDARAQADHPALRFAYLDDERVPPDRKGAVRDLKPAPRVARQLLDECATRPRRVSALVAGWFSELSTSNEGDTKPTAFHFTAGNQKFLAIVDQSRKGIDADDVREALAGPWTNTSPLPSLRWDGSGVRQYALRARAPTDEKNVGSVPAANWLAVVAMEFFPVVADRGRLATTAVAGGWKDATFSWPLWSVPATAYASASLLRVDARRWTAAERAALGITRVYAADILRSDQGGYGSFSPASVVLPRDERRRT